MYQPVHEQLARDRHVQRERAAHRTSVRRSARLISLDIRRQRRSNHR